MLFVGQDLPCLHALLWHDRVLAAAQGNQFGQVSHQTQARSIV